MAEVDPIRSFNCRLLLWLFMAAGLVMALFYLTAPWSILSYDEAARNAAKAREQDSVARYLNSAVKTEGVPGVQDHR